MTRFKATALLALFSAALVSAQETKPASETLSLDKFKPAKAPKPSGLVLKKGDRLAICGDSITEQKMYSRLIEDYLTMCVPDLEVSVRQFGWGGEQAVGFLARMTNDCLRFRPTIATTCYGMNDHEYRAYDEGIGERYWRNSTFIVRAFKAYDARVIQGSPGCVGAKVGWSKDSSETLNLNLCNLRNLGIQIAEKENVGFADVFWPMLTAGIEARKKYHQNYAIAGTDGVHPNWAGHTVMAYAFLKAFGLDGDLGVFTADLQNNKMQTTKGHEVLSAKDGEFQIKSRRYPFCVCAPKDQSREKYPTCGDDPESSDNSIRSAMTLIPFEQELNRLTLKSTGGKAQKYEVTWGTESKSFTAEQLKNGINLAEAFVNNPFSDAFAKVDGAIAAKQAYETTQIKQLFRSPEAKADMEAIAAKSEKERAPLVEAIKTAFVPVTHTIKIVAE